MRTVMRLSYVFVYAVILYWMWVCEFVLMNTCTKTIIRTHHNR